MHREGTERSSLTVQPLTCQDYRAGSQTEERAIPSPHGPPKPNISVQATAYSLVSLIGDVGESRHAVPGRDRPIEPWFAETEASRGSSRPGLPKPAQLFGAIEPVSARSGRQEFG